ncbi:GNAT family N-acetyltransferase [Paenibacillus aestuarii]|uniref:GNAT family N-acetyltransferase n=1 Tax=Paenibacillus aestuarii TaxID=516965 RepID=A0ABW0K8N1_9BACL|nr:GNAT family N-acetyltransferase [Paenibacillus aestuarii]
MFTIRPVTEQDVPFLWEMLYESLYVPDGQAPISRNMILEPFLSKYVEGWGRNGDLGFVAVNKEGHSVGSITARYYSEENKGFGYVRDDIPELGMALRADYRGKGIGKALMIALIHELKANGVEGVSLSVDPGNLPAARLYRSFGFQEVGVVGTSVTMVAYL